MNRRNFVVRSFTGVGALFLAASTTACWFSGNVFTQIMAYVGVGLTAFQAVVSLVPGFGPQVEIIVQLVKAGFADLQLAVQDYNNAPAANKATLLGKISTVLADLQSEIDGFWANLNLPTGTLSTLVKGLLGIILSTLAGFATLLPQPVGAKTQFNAKTIGVTPQKRSKKEFENDFNAAMVAGGQPAVKFN